MCECVVNILILSRTTLCFLSLFLSIDNMVNQTKVEISETKATELEKKVKSTQTFDGKKINASTQNVEHKSTIRSITPAINSYYYSQILIDHCQDARSQKGKRRKFFSFFQKLSIHTFNRHQADKRSHKRADTQRG